MIERKISSDKELKELSPVPYSKILFTYADRKDKLLIVIGLISSSLCGLGLPSIVFLFGDIADSFLLRKPDLILDAISFTAATLSIIGVAVGICGYIFFTSLMIASERIGMRTRVAYLEAILR